MENNTNYINTINSINSLNSTLKSLAQIQGQSLYTTLSYNQFQSILNQLKNLQHTITKYTKLQPLNKITKI